MSTTEQRSRSERIENYPYFDWLRVVLALVVALSHDGVSFGLRDAAHFAVLVFFALSGWLIGGILLNSSPTDLPKFYFNRAARIWIPYFLSVAILFSVSLLKESPDAQWFEFLFYDLTFTHNLFITPRIHEVFLSLPLSGTNNHYWSISVEEQFYLISPFILVLLNKWRPAAIVALTVGSFIFAPLFSTICLGVLGAYVNKAYPGWRRHVIARWMLPALAIVMFAGLYFEALPYQQAAPFTALSIVAALAKTGPRSPTGQFFGGISYPLYLNHWIAIFIAHEIYERTGGSLVWAKMLTAILALAIASAFYLCVDKVIQKRRSAFFTVKRGVALAAAAYSLLVIGVAGGLIIGFSAA